jgi:hypothetical protein
MKYRISGADATTGAERKVIVDADDETIALALAKQQGIFPYGVEVVSNVPAPPAPPVATRPHRKTRAERKQEEKLIAGVVAGIFMLLLLVAFTTIGSWLSNDQASQPTYVPAQRFSPPLTSSEPLFYPEGGTRDWSNLNGTETQDIWGYKIPKDPELRRQYFKDMEAENERTWQELVRDGIVEE